MGLQSKKAKDLLGLGRGLTLTVKAGESVEVEDERTGERSYVTLKRMTSSEASVTFNFSRSYIIRRHKILERCLREKLEHSTD